ncbi:MAG TPA: hypothetical protein VI522_05435, partial [Gammaproteobacteria bacterium]|nr:hypothetical protein [Gammaproteobacteria bacterium]
NHELLLELLDEKLLDPEERLDETDEKEAYLDAKASDVIAALNAEELLALELVAVLLRSNTSTGIKTLIEIVAAGLGPNSSVTSNINSSRPM